MKISRSMEYSAALYIRLSKEDDHEGPSESVINQKSLLNEFVAQHDLFVYNTYVDDGWSGTTFERPGFQQMIDDIEAKKVNMVITKDLSRLGRDYIMTGHYMERYFPEHQIRYISLLDGIDTGVESTNNDITPFRAIMNDMYAKDISHKVKSVKHDQQMQGKYIGKKAPYGYIKDPNDKYHLIIDEEAAAVVRLIFSMAAEGQTLRQIAAYLNEKGIPTPSVYAGLTYSHASPYMGLWYTRRLSDIVKNEVYLGNVVQRRTVKVSYKSKKQVKQKPEDWVIVEGTHEPIIDRDTFDIVQRQIESRRSTRSRTYDYLLKGLIFCHECGYRMTVVNRKNADKESVMHLYCTTHYKFSNICTAHYMKLQTVTDAVIAKVREVCESYLNSEHLLSAAEKAVKEKDPKKQTEAELQSLERELQCLTANLDRMYMDRLNGLLAETDFQRIYQKIQNKCKAVEKRQEELKRQNESSRRNGGEAKELVHRFAESAFTSRELLVSLIDRVELTAQKEIIVKFRFQELEQFNC